MRVAPSNEAQRARTLTLLSGELPPAVLPNPLRPRAWAAGPQRCRRDRGLHPLHLALAEPWSPCALLSWRPCRVRSPDELLHVDVSWRSGVLACKRCFQWLVGNVWTPVSHDEGAKRDARECASRSLWVSSPTVATIAAAAAAAAATTAAAATAAAAATTVAAAATTAATGAGLTFLGNADAERTTFEVRTVELGNGFLS